MMEYRSQLTEDDLASANRVLLSWRRSRKYYLVIFAIFFIIFALSFIPKLGTEDRTSIIVTLVFDTILAVVAISVITAITYVLVPRRARKLFRQQKALHAQASIGWSDEGFSYKSELTSSRHPWTHYRQWGENKDVLVMFLTDTQFNLVPKREIPDGALEELRSLLAKAGIQRVGKRAKPESRSD